MDTEHIRQLNDQHIINTYGTRKMAIVRGEGARLWDADGREYLDFFAGIAVCNLGHCHPRVTEAICRQAAAVAAGDGGGCLDEGPCAAARFRGKPADLAARQGDRLSTNPWIS